MIPILKEQTLHCASHGGMECEVYVDSKTGKISTLALGHDGSTLRLYRDDLDVLEALIAFARSKETK